MLKEIYEQPKAVENTISPRIKDGQIVLDELGLSEDEIRTIRKIYIIACGSAYHVGVSAKCVLEKMTRIPVEVKSRGAYIMAVTNEGNHQMENLAAFTLYIPEASHYFATSLAIIPLQLLAYYVSVAKGLDVDKPRNLAKSVTVE
ncbi:glucosamine--fructose-6-phosphate aminotransferase (isomerizing) [Anaerobium acetethylicum]|uniref:Glutamine--fructose-6-phosphate aminotransferase [isomerizing] n=1 Tax=Anaerobium acetethylicum TaxID=1619234 RepID=A0A1D3TNC4_9FIRM|nr:hypothetical protein [Anaerobium acetethylicum]SCP94829.1 glucosamine--fructose-6-phosphate aminotransferase (isomerizing) [Anaerobium acetethylicum]